MSRIEYCGRTMGFGDTCCAGYPCNDCWARERAAKAPEQQFFECDGKGGVYERLGYAKPSGALRTIHGEGGIIVYRDTKTGQLYFRDPGDFQQRMRLLPR